MPVLFLGPLPAETHIKVTGVPVHLGWRRDNAKGAEPHASLRPSFQMK
jgi:hypothetical protein